MDELMKLALQRFADMGIKLSEEMKDRVYYSILGELVHNGYDMAYQYVTTAKLTSNWTRKVKR